MGDANVSINTQTREIIIQNLTIKNPDVYEFLHDKENISDWTERAIIIGCSGLKQMVVTDRVDYIEKEFQKFAEQTIKLFEKFDLKNIESPLFKIQEIMVKYFDAENGQLKKMLDGYFNQDQGEIRKIIDKNFDLNNKTSAFSVLVHEIKENSDLEEDKIRELLDPNKIDSPIKLLKEDLIRQVKDLQERDLKDIAEKIKDLKENEIKDIRDKLIEEEARDEEYQRGTQKGLDFEEDVYLQMEKLARPYSDSISHEGTKKGKTGKTGDILIDINGDAKKRIVIECKTKKAGIKEIKNEILDALDNRSAQFCIYLFSAEDLIPSEYSPLKIESNFIITCMNEQNLHLSYRLARELLDITKERGSEVDYAKITVLLDEIEKIIRDIHQMETESTKIINAGNYLKTNLEKLQANVEIRIGKIRAHIGSQ